METKSSIRYIALELNIPYDWDDYGVWKSNFYDTVEHKIITDTFGHGTESEHEPVSIDWRKALEEGIVTREEIAQAVLERVGSPKIDVYDLDCSADYCIECSINKGRKLKGDNLYFVKCYLEYNSYDHKHYRYAVVVDKEKKMKCSTSAYNVDLHIDTRKNIIDKVVNSDGTASLGKLIHTIAYLQSYSSCDREFFNASMRQLANVKAGEKIDLADYADPWQDEIDKRKNKKLQARIADERPNIEAWAKNKFPNKTDEERAEIVEKVITKQFR